MTEEKSDKQEYDPGWNDPPLFSYQCSQELDQKQRGLKLNKRVAYPMSPAELPVAPQPMLVKDGPPKGPASPSVKPKTGLSTSQEYVELEGSDQENLMTTLANFRSVLDDCFNDSKTESDSILKRIDLLESLWAKSDFLPVIKTKVYRLSIALKSRDVSDAENIQRSLMVDYPSLCSSWMPGIRKLLHAIREVK